MIIYVLELDSIFFLFCLLLLQFTCYNQHFDSRVEFNVSKSSFLGDILQFISPCPDKHITHGELTYMEINYKYIFTEEN